MTNEIALVDDDVNLLTLLALSIEAEGFAVRRFTDPRRALEVLTEQPADLAILDIKMPGMDGFELLSRLRKTDAAMPVIFLTSKSDEIDEVMGLRLGADGYIKKPVSHRLLIERIRTLLRRAELVEGSAGVTEPAMKRGDLWLDFARHRCTWRGIQIDLTMTELLLLKSLACRPGHVRSRDQLIAATQGRCGQIDSHLKRLRGKFKSVDPDFCAFQTLHRAGYRFLPSSMPQGQQIGANPNRRNRRDQTAL